MAEITRTNTEAVARVTSANKKITVTGLKALTVEESRELRALLKAEEKKAAKQTHWYSSYSGGGFTNFVVSNPF